MTTACASNGRKPGSVLSATCCQCGDTEPSTFAGRRYLCQACQLERAGQVRALAADGLGQCAIGRAMGLSQCTIGSICNKYGISTAHNQAVKRPTYAPGMTRGPDRLMPSSRAIQARTIFDFAAGTP